jgi:hypothetical protein
MPAATQMRLRLKPVRTAQKTLQGFQRAKAVFAGYGVPYAKM